ncbi:MAG: hypothetical protein F6K13_32215 [Okeania sp. SIO2B9]|nr:hypothetical protein [Okeania sp. SIO2B9]
MLIPPKLPINPILPTVVEKVAPVVAPMDIYGRLSGKFLLIARNPLMFGSRKMCV